jgi:hypothetical protein
MKKMIRFIAVTILMLFVTSLCFAQENTEKAPIEIEKKGLGYRYTYQDKPLKIPDNGKFSRSHFQSKKSSCKFRNRYGF